MCKFYKQGKANTNINEKQAEKIKLKKKKKTFHHLTKKLGFAKKFQNVFSLSLYVLSNEAKLYLAQHWDPPHPVWLSL